MKSVITFLICFSSLLLADANPESELLLPTSLNRILAKVDLATEREQFISMIKEAFPESYFESQVGGLATGSITIRLNKRYELGARVRSGKDNWLISEKKYYLTDLQSMTCTIVSIEPIKPSTDAKALIEEAEQKSAGDNRQERP